MNADRKARVAAISREVSRIRPSDLAIAVDAKHLVNKGEAGLQRGGMPGQQAGEHVSQGPVSSGIIDMPKSDLEQQNRGETLAKPGVEVGHSRASGVMMRAYIALAAAKTAFWNAWRAA